MKRTLNRRVSLFLGSGALLAAILVSLGILLNAERVNRLEGQTLQEAILTQNSWLIRLVLALGETRTVASGEGSDPSSFADQSETLRSLLSQARLAPPLPSRDSLEAVLGEDPLMVIPQLMESNEEYGRALAEMESLYDSFEGAGPPHEVAAEARVMEQHLERLQEILAIRGNIITQLEATLHSRLRSVQRSTGRQLTVLLLFPICALLFGSLLVAAVFKAQAKRVTELETLIPICSRCKNVRDDTGYWERVESYMKRHTEMQFTHGLCPDCAEALYPELSSGEE